jgi:hypothetical protein
MALSVQQLEAAINYWRERAPARGDACALSQQVKLLAPVYALMIVRRAATLDPATLDQDVQQLLDAWRTHTENDVPDA